MSPCMVCGEEWLHEYKLLCDSCEEEWVAEIKESTEHWLKKISEDLKC